MIARTMYRVNRKHIYKTFAVQVSRACSAVLWSTFDSSWCKQNSFCVRVCSFGRNHNSMEYKEKLSTGNKKSVIKEVKVVLELRRSSY